MQPLDGLMKPLKTNNAQEFDTWLVSRPGRVVTPVVVCSLLASAYGEVARIGSFTLLASRFALLFAASVRLQLKCDGTR